MATSGMATTSGDLPARPFLQAAPRLPDEVLHNVAQCLSACRSARTLADLQQASRAVYRTITPVLYSTLHLADRRAVGRLLDVVCDLGEAEHAELAELAAPPDVARASARSCHPLDMPRARRLRLALSHVRELDVPAILVERDAAVCRRFAELNDSVTPGGLFPSATLLGVHGPATAGSDAACGPAHAVALPRYFAARLPSTAVALSVRGPEAARFLGRLGALPPAPRFTRLCLHSTQSARFGVHAGGAELVVVRFARTPAVMRGPAENIVTRAIGLRELVQRGAEARADQGPAAAPGSPVHTVRKIILVNPLGCLVPQAGPTQRRDKKAHRPGLDEGDRRLAYQLRLLLRNNLMRGRDDERTDGEQRRRYLDHSVEWVLPGDPAFDAPCPVCGACG